MSDVALVLLGAGCVLAGVLAGHFAKPKPVPVEPLPAPPPQIIVKSVGRSYSVVSTDGEFKYDEADARDARIAWEGVKENTEGKQWFLLEDGVPREAVS